MSVSKQLQYNVGPTCKFLAQFQFNYFLLRRVLHKERGSSLLSRVSNSAWILTTLPNVGDSDPCNLNVKACSLLPCCSFIDVTILYSSCPFYNSLLFEFVWPDLSVWRLLIRRLISGISFLMLSAWLHRISFWSLLTTTSLSFLISSTHLSPGRSGMGIFQCRDSSHSGFKRHSHQLWEKSLGRML